MNHPVPDQRVQDLLGLDRDLLAEEGRLDDPDRVVEDQQLDDRVERLDLRPGDLLFAVEDILHHREGGDIRDHVALVPDLLRHFASHPLSSRNVCIDGYGVSGAGWNAGRLKPFF